MAATENIIAVDDQEEELFTDYGSGLSTDTTSLSSSVMHYQYENGHRYHGYKEGHYYFPNDEAEQDRMDLLHHCWRLRLGGALHLAPLEQGIQRVLDIGTGTGIWAIDFADEYPSADVLGNDISPIQPRWVPPNVHFEVDDCEANWTYPKDHFDYIHGRVLGGSITDWDRLFQQAYDHLAPGGWFELQDIDCLVRAADDSVPHDDPLLEWSRKLCGAAETTGRSITAEVHFKKYFERAGFEDVTQKVFKSALGTWPKDKTEKQVGVYYGTQTMEGIEGLGMALFTRVLKWDPKDFKDLCAKAKKTIKDRNKHCYNDWYFVYGRKPMPEEKGKAKKK